MNLETMFSDQKWNILASLSEAKLSPMQLAEKLNTSMANVSQQLRLLEASQLVKKEKISNRDKGKPRTLFSLSQEQAYLIPTMHNFADKQLLSLDVFQKMRLKAWYLSDPGLSFSVEKLLWYLKPHFSAIEAIYVDEPHAKILIATNNKASLNSIVKKIDHDIVFVTSKQIETTKQNLTELYHKQS